MWVFSGQVSIVHLNNFNQSNVKLRRAIDQWVKDQMRMELIGMYLGAVVTVQIISIYSYHNNLQLQ
jgi:hypothetical protein